MKSERRQFQRIRLERPMVGRLGTTNIVVLDVGVSGALLEHHALIPVKERRRLVFNWEQHEIALECEVVRSTVARFTGSGDKKTPVYNSGVHFVGALGESDRRLREMIGRYVTRALEKQKANARGAPFEGIGDSTLSRVIGLRGDTPRGYISCRLDGSGWKKTPTLKTQQPPDGFTVSAGESEIDLLCRTYRAANEEGRRLIRILAELSVSQTAQIPPVRYEP